ncbi:hypothetical protein EPIR_2475 [Erwinia piriflorinigrans CFBP 5888]|uniref:Uncharacterized protein n=1 Tax=Erwinia piriflorinigrans CFBP 5888 TaxID=1161919 RepID=V5ZA58_9GAMM|nr:hypothetical protein EPIR_2475 [Erwinia piriflorinigrans CFBP 5888]
MWFIPMILPKDEPQDWGCAIGQSSSGDAVADFRHENAVGQIKRGARNSSASLSWRRQSDYAVRRLAS